ncbi:MAG: hypothetical protein QM607_11000, partial [Microbacterium sp.]
LGRIAVLLALLAGLGALLVDTICAFLSGLVVARGGGVDWESSDPISWDQLTPARDAVATAEFTFWAATVIGIIAIVLGIVAIAKRRGRGAGIAAVIISVLAPGLVLGAAFLGFVIGAS